MRIVIVCFYGVVAQVGSVCRQILNRPERCYEQNARVQIPSTPFFIGSVLEWSNKLGLGPNA